MISVGCLIQAVCCKSRELGKLKFALSAHWRQASTFSCNQIEFYNGTRATLKDCGYRARAIFRYIQLTEVERPRYGCHFARRRNDLYRLISTAAGKTNNPPIFEQGSNLEIYIKVCFSQRASSDVVDIVAIIVLPGCPVAPAFAKSTHSVSPGTTASRIRLLSGDHAEINASTDAKACVYGRPAWVTRADPSLVAS